MSFSKILLRFSPDLSSITSLGIMLLLTLILMVFIHYYFYSNSSAPQEEKSSLNSSEPKIMAFKYDVFLSFRGEDTRKNFVDHLYHALMGKGIYTYKDDENIKQGKMISDELTKAIEDSRFYIIVFSKNYASSSWCLDELVKIMECQKMTEHIAYPVFYDVQPTEVRNQSGAVGKAFAKHKKEAAARKWREALKEAAHLAGFELKSMTNGHEAKFIQAIIEKISIQVDFNNSSSDGDLIGMETRVKEVISSLEPGVGDVRMLGIWGMGGAGKTTLARAIFDQISIQFDGASFIYNVREVSKASSEGIKKLQKEVLSEVLMDKNIKVSGKNMMQRRMHGIKALIVLDDVDHKDQLEGLSGDLNWFKPGSRIIITTRDKQVLTAHGVELIQNVTLLSEAEAGCLFSRYAFGRENPIQGYEELSGKVLRYAGGLPLTIKVMGLHLRGLDESEWKNAIKRLETIPCKDTMKVLELSYDSLEEDCQQIFLDVACILKGQYKEEAIRELESRGFYGTYGLRVLEQKSLIAYDKHGNLWMHDHLEEMGRNIVRRSGPDEPERHSRLWVKEEIEYILTNELGTSATKCLRFWEPGFSAEIAIKGLAKMKDLKVLHIWSHNSIKWKFDKVSEYLPSSLRFMRWWGFPFSSLPNTFQGKHLVGLDMYDNKIVKLWENGEEKVLHKLRFFTIKYSKLRTFDLRLAPNLESLIIIGCKDFIELHIPADHCLKLEHLDLSSSKLTNRHLGNFPNLKTLNLSGHDLVGFQMPTEILKLEHLDLSHSKLKTIHLGSTPNLEELRLVGCNDLVEVQMPAESLKLQRLNLSYSKLKTIHLGNTPYLEELTLDGCNDLVELEMPSECLKLERLNLSIPKLKMVKLRSTPNLKSLRLAGCKDLIELEMPSKCLKLELLYLSLPKLTTIHLGSTQNLEELRLVGCNDLVELEMPSKSIRLERLYLSLPKLKTIHLGSTPNLEELRLVGCNDLVELEKPSKCRKLQRLNLSHSKLKTIHLGNTPYLEELTLDGCNDLIELKMPSECRSLECLNLSLPKLKTIDLEGTSNLKSLRLVGCNDLVEVEMPAESLKLERLNLSHSKLKTVNLGNTPYLEELTLDCCNDLVELEMPSECLKLKRLNLSLPKLKMINHGNTRCLEELTLDGCNDLIELEMPSKGLKLERLYLSLPKLKTIHLGSTPNLKSLRLVGCNDLVEVEMPAKSLKLERLNLSHSKLKTINLGNTPYLEELTLDCCNDLIELEMPSKCLKLELLYLSLPKLKTIHLGSTQNLEELRLVGCNDLVELEMPSKSIRLERLYLSLPKLKTIHLGSTPNLKSLRLVGCKTMFIHGSYPTDRRYKGHNKSIFYSKYRL